MIDLLCGKNLLIIVWFGGDKVGVRRKGWRLRFSLGEMSRFGFGSRE